MTKESSTAICEFEAALCAVHNADESNLHHRLRVLALASTQLFKRVEHLEATIRHLWAGDPELVETTGLEDLL